MVEVKYIEGKSYVRPTDLIPNPTNTMIYDQNAVEELVKSFEGRVVDGLTPNMQSVTYWKETGMIDIGHTRVLAAIKSGQEWIWATLSDSPIPDGSAPYDEIMHTLEGNVQRIKNWSVKLGEYQSAKNAYRDQYGLDMPSSVEAALIKGIGTTKQTLRKVAEIKLYAPELMTLIDAGEGVDRHWMKATGQLNTNVTPAKTNGMDLSKLFEDKGTRSKLISVAIKYAKDLRDLKMKFDEFDISPFELDECGRWEPGAFTTFLSHAFMSAMAGVLREQGYNVRTASGHRDDPDIYLIDEDEKIEVKVTQFNGHGASTTWKGGKNIREGKYLLVIHDLDFEYIFVAFTDLDQDDWGISDVHGKKTMTFSTWFKNHGDDAEIWKGDAQNVKTNKIKKGQVQLQLAPINDPI